MKTITLPESAWITANRYSYAVAGKENRFHLVIAVPGLEKSPSLLSQTSFADLLPIEQFEFECALEADISLAAACEYLEHSHR